ncbi:type VI secretion system baseplate subunit TssG [Aquabacter spiritensis]|uniref:Type VI secretion system protein ImpH n=1 Tax=Aquabacter spiritensis TaxID=933073 RepID=A0A4R3LVI8_9HYPH|nr:type VI secretion system baseplate subunit TssG [Aquabacter spiritensis]TCT02457.1 type VI secretion system protein ImpH [Aquabacter spiritensis]
MAGSGGISSSPLIRALLDAPESFDLVQAIRVLEGVQRAVLHQADEEFMDSGASELRVGLSSARFLSDANLKYPPSAITAASQRGDGPVQLTVSLFGLLGPMGVLPYAYTEHAIEAHHNNNEALRAFFDIFQHRAVTLFYRASSKYRIAISREQHDPGPGGKPDAFTTALRGLTGLALPATMNRLAFPDSAVLHHAGLFSGQTRSLTALEDLLTSELKQAVEVVPFVGEWVQVPDDEQTRLGGIYAGRHAQLGASAMAGARCWVAQQHFRINIGPVEEPSLRALLPDQPLANLIADIVHLFCGIEFGFDVNVVVKAHAVPPARLASSPEDTDGARLGQMAWLLSAPSPVDRADAIYSVDRLS